LVNSIVSAVIGVPDYACACSIHIHRAQRRFFRPASRLGTLALMLAARALAALLLLALAGCGATVTRLSDPAQRFPVQGLEVAAPAGADWVLADRSDQRVVFARTGARADNAWAAWVQTLRAPEPLDGYYPLARLVARYTAWADRGRYRVLAQQTQPAGSAVATCIERRMKVEDTARSAGAAPMVMRVADYFCRHPADSRMLVLVHLSEQDRADGAFGSFDDAATRFFSGVKF
jgi:hypothetical protein